jgi:hypothetical protein
VRNYLLRAGFRDRGPGLIASVMNAYYVFLKFAKLWELQRTPAVDERGTGRGTAATLR